MPNITMRPAWPRSQLHQENWGNTFAQGWRRWRLRWARHRQRTVLRDLADDPHLLEDIGVTRAEALKEAERPAWDINDVYVHSL